MQVWEVQKRGVGYRSCGRDQSPSLWIIQARVRTRGTWSSSCRTRLHSTWREPLGILYLSPARLLKVTVTIKKRQNEKDYFRTGQPGLWNILKIIQKYCTKFVCVFKNCVMCCWGQCSFWSEANPTPSPQSYWEILPGIRCHLAGKNMKKGKMNGENAKGKEKQD